MEFKNYTNQSEADFKVKCPECGMGSESRNHRDVLQFAKGHEKHTGHEVEWVTLDFDAEPDLDPMESWDVWCEVCGEEWSFRTEDKAESFKEDHSTYTNHVISGMEKRTDGDLATATVKGAVSALDVKFGLYAGVPFSAIATLFAKNGYAEDQIQDWLIELEDQEEVYQTEPGHFRPENSQMDEFGP